MALLKCPDCNNECSDKASTCPKCGRPLEKQRSLITQDIGFGGVIYSLILIIGVVFGFKGYFEGWLLVAIGGVLLLVRLKVWTGIKHQ